MWGTVAQDFALQNNRGQLRKLNDPDTHLLDKAVQPACLSAKPTLVLQLWQEYKVGLNGNKPAHKFTMSKQNCARDVKQTWQQRNKVWAHIEKMINSGFSAEGAIYRNEQVYVSNISITMLIHKIPADKGGHPNLR